MCSPIPHCNYQRTHKSDCSRRTPKTGKQSGITNRGDKQGTQLYANSTGGCNVVSTTDSFLHCPIACHPLDDKFTSRAAGLSLAITRNALSARRVNFLQRRPDATCQPEPMLRFFSTQKTCSLKQKTAQKYRNCRTLL